MKTKRILALTLTALMVMSMAAGCKKEPKGEDESSKTSTSQSSSEKTSSKEKEEEKVSEYQVEVPKDNRTKYEELKKDVEEKGLDKSGRVVAYLEVPGTDVKDVVMQYDKDKDLAHFQANHEAYYERKDIYGNYSFEGCFFMDYEQPMQKGTKEDMPQNTVIYGHHLGNPQGVTNDPDGIKFGQLLRYRDKAFAEKTPYIYLTTESEDLVYQVFAVSDAPMVTSPVEYNFAKYSDEDFMKLVKDMRNRSYYDYPDVTVEADDKILTLSTCVYDYGNYSVNPRQRFLVFAKLVKGQYFEEKAKVEENKDRRLPTYATGQAS